MAGSWDRLWDWYQAHATTIQPFLAPLATLIGTLFTLVVGTLAFYIALRQVKVASRQAQIAFDRHREQTLSDKQRRLIETYSRAVMQLASDKIVERLGGIYTLERISKESADDYWTVMETLTAFVRDQTRRPGATNDVSSATFDESRPKTSYECGMGIASRPFGRRTDIAAVLTVIKRRYEQNITREDQQDWRFDLSEF